MFRVRIKFSKDSPYGAIEEIQENITEIHFNFPNSIGKRIAFESDIDGNGVTHDIAHIDEFEAKVI